MKWKGRRRSSNVEDARGKRVSGGSGAGAGMLLNLVGRTFGIKGIIVLILLGLVGWKMGLVDPSMLTGGPATVQEVEYTPSADEEQLKQFVEVVLADTEDIWSREFRGQGRQYQPPTLVFYKDRYPTACGMGDARMGPFYCPADKQIYIDLSFYDDLESTFEAPGDFAQAYVIAHEVGHHVQNLLGISEPVHARRGQPDFKQQSVRLELQADFLSGLWARHNSHYLEAGDIQEAMRAANQIGDDAIQLRTQGKVVPHAFTHGTSEQRMRWFNRGYETANFEAGNTFDIAYEAL